ncbi:hypothetical protein [Streptomyces sp. NPDC057616]|uniref:hypothetical protein n=1 Tax=Streptomyces sp. NPDC057616 TaxID=3346183 RepID=UPI0036B60CA2
MPRIVPLLAPAPPALPAPDPPVSPAAPPVVHPAAARRNATALAVTVLLLNCPVVTGCSG